MAATPKTTILIEKSLFDRSKRAALQLDISPDQLFEIAVESFIKNNPVQASPANREQVVVNQGDIYWIRPENPGETQLGFYPHPYVIVQDNLFNHSRVESVIVCALTTNIKQANAPGNILLEEGEANLPKRSAIVVSKISAVDKSQLGEFIGSLSGQRIEQILARMRFLQTSFFRR